MLGIFGIVRKILGGLGEGVGSLLVGGSYESVEFLCGLFSFLDG